MLFQSKILFLVAAYFVLILLLALRRPLYQAILGSIVLTVLLFRIPVVDVGISIVQVFSEWSTLSILLSLYLISFLQRLMESRSLIRLAQRDLDSLIHNRRVSTVACVLFIGMLPSAASMLLCSDIMKEATDGHLNAGEQAFVTNWFRHIPESCLPTYTYVLLLLALTEMNAGAYFLGMLLPIAVMLLLGYLTYLRKIPKHGACPVQGNTMGTKLKSMASLVKHLWTLGAILILILAFGVDIVWSILIVLCISVFVYRVSLAELKQTLLAAFDWKLLGNTFLVLVFTKLLSLTEVLALLPEVLSGLPLPGYLIFALLIFFATIVSGTTGAIAMCVPLMTAAMPCNLPLVVYISSVAHAASQISPTHVCLSVAADCFGVSLGDLIRKTLPVAVVHVAIMTIFYTLVQFFMR